ncbi:MAG: DNA repair protein RadC [Erysipelotrichaceae bacterium]|nr:DNA repair protein RadC [Erysipelotrichaceae bacterium]
MKSDLMPREKALEYGIASLSETELLALIIKSAYKNKNVFDLARDVIDLANGFENLLSLNYEELIMVKGIKKAKALEIMAILEIAKRLSRIDHVSEAELSSPAKVVEWLRFNLGFCCQEQFFVIYLNGRNGIIRSEVMYKGNKNMATVGVDEILRKAILMKASGILVAHNHPSGNVKPSHADIELTQRLSQACQPVSIPLVDHIIVSKSGYFSFKNHSMLE